jgi:hypothetical protein
MGKESSDSLPTRAHSRAGSGEWKWRDDSDELDDEETVAYFDEAMSTLQRLGAR